LVLRCLVGISCTLLIHAAAPLTPQQQRGKDIFQACSGCHNVLTDARKSAPSLRTLFGKVRLRNGKRTTEDNVAQLILDGYNSMPSYRHMFRPDDWTDLLSYLRTLRGRPEVGISLPPIRGSDEEVLAAGRNFYQKRCGSCHDGVQPAKAPELLSVYSRGQLTTGEPVREAAIVARVKDNHGDTVSGSDTPDDDALFSLMAFLKAQ
jgi:cytochrome c2